MKSTTLRTASKVGITAGALLAVGLIGAASSSAAVTYTVKAGTTTTGTTPVRGTTQPIAGSDNQIIFKNTTTGVNLGCVSGTANGSATLGPAVGAAVGKITKTTWRTCQGPAGITLTPKEVGTWQIKASGRTSAAGVTKASVTNVNATVTGTGCTFTVKGAATGSYNNSTQVLSLAPLAAPTAAQKLTVSAVSGCFGAINNGDNVTFTANYKLVATAGALSIKSN